MSDAGYDYNWIDQYNIVPFLFERTTRDNVR
jgi:hypothetical protein